MKLLVLCDSAGNIKSVAVPHPELPVKLQLEVEGGPTGFENPVRKFGCWAKTSFTPMPNAHGTMHNAQTRAVTRRAC